MKYLMILFLICMALSGCAKDIGDSCSRDMDCSADGDRTCDNSQPGGYCLIITCQPDQCPGEAVCAEFETPSPEFDTDVDSESNEALYSQLSSNRTRTYCLKKCKSNKACRDAYHCALDTELEDEKGLNALIIDSKNEGIGVCVPD